MTCDTTVLDDIEDIGEAIDGLQAQNFNDGYFDSHRTRRTADWADSSIISDKCRIVASGSDYSREESSFIAGTAVIYMKTWGCSHNSSDSEYMAGQLAAAGYTLTDNDEKAQVWLLNSCTVKTPAEQHLENTVKKGLDQGKFVVVAGCVAQASPRTPWLKGLSLLGVQQIDRVVEVVEETLKGNSVRLLGKKKDGLKKLGGASLSLPKIRKNPLIEILAINTGCLNQCTYCKTKQARGDLGSYTIEELVERARQAFSEGVVELWLTSEDLGAYGHDIDVRLPQLLWRLIEVIPDGCMMRLGMTNPPYILEHLEEIGEILNHPKVYAFLHIPVQSGSDPVLHVMRREYSVSDFEYVVDYLRNHVPGISIATDVICGFPMETVEDFNGTLTLIEKYKFPSLFTNQFFPRPGTPAAKMRRIDTVEVKRRTKAMSELFQSYFPYAGREGAIYDVLVTEEASDKMHWVAHNKFYEQILLPKQDNLLGSRVRVRIVHTTKHSMTAEILRVERKLATHKTHREQLTVIGTTWKPRSSWWLASMLCCFAVFVVVRSALLLLHIPWKHYEF